MSHAILKALYKILESLGIPPWVLWTVVVPLALIGYGIMVRDWFRFLAELRRTTAAYGGRGLLGAFFFTPGVRFTAHGIPARIWHSGWMGVTRLEFRIAPAGRVWIRSRPFSDRERRRFKGEIVTTDDPHFDTSFTAAAAPARFGVELLDTEIRHHLTTLQSVSLAALGRRTEGEFGGSKLPNPKVEVVLDRGGLRLRFDGRPAGEEIERVIRAGAEVARRASELRPR